MNDIAFVFKKSNNEQDAKNGIIAIDKQNKFVLKPFIFDNGPDYLQEGLFRFTENGKMGFADVNGKKVIPAKYTFVEPYTMKSVISKKVWQKSLKREKKYGLIQKVKL